jgi:hypothetical protein
MLDNSSLSLDRFPLCSCRVYEPGDTVKYGYVKLVDQGWGQPYKFNYVSGKGTIVNIVEGEYDTITSATFGAIPGTHRVYNVFTNGENTRLSCGVMKA